MRFVLFLLFFIPPLLALIDARRASEAQWQAIGQKRMYWMVAIVVAAIISPLAGLVCGGIYLVRVKPRLAQTAL